jgi:hypothetical protein
MDRLGIAVDAKTLISPISPDRICSTDSRPLHFFVSMLTKEFATPERVQPSFIDPMQVTAVCALPNGGPWWMRPSSTARPGFNARQRTRSIAYFNGTSLISTKMSKAHRPELETIVS